MTLDWNDAWKPQQPTRERHLQPLPPVASGEASAYALTALDRETQAVAEAGEGTRNHTLNRAAFNLGQIVAAGQLSATTVEEQLLNAAHRAGLPTHEAQRTINSGLNGGVKSGPRQIAPLEHDTGPALTINQPAGQQPATPVGHITREHVDEATGEITEQPVDFWQTRPVLAHIREFAYARMASPWAVLGVILLRALATVPPHVVLPALIGGPGSLNLFASLVGSSGFGKGAAESAAVDAIRMPVTIYTASVGSGEGIAHQYAHREKGEIVQDRASVLFSVPEVDTLTALGNRQGSTLLSQLRSAFSGERLGFGYADAMKRIPIERHSYRLGMTVGVQPEKAGPLLDDADGGTPQRFIWLPVTDPNISSDRPDEPEPWPLGMINWQKETSFRRGRHVFTVPDHVATYICDQHAARARGQGHALDGHALFAREKVAAALAVLDRRAHVNDEDWQLSGAVMRVSDLTRARVQATLSEQFKKSEQARSTIAAQRAAAASEAVVDAAVQRVCRNLLRHVQGAGEIDWGTLRNKLPSRDRDHYEDAVCRLAEAGQLSIVEEPDQRSPDGVARTVRAASTP